MYRICAPILPLGGNLLDTLRFCGICGWLGNPLGIPRNDCGPTPIQFPKVSLGSVEMECSCEGGVKGGLGSAQTRQTPLLYPFIPQQECFIHRRDQLYPQVTDQIDHGEHRDDDSAADVAPLDWSHAREQYFVNPPNASDSTHTQVLS